LLGLGHTRIAYEDFIFHSERAVEMRHYSVTDRYEGYAAAMKTAGLQPRRLSTERVDERHHVAVIKAALQNAERPTAILTYYPHGTALSVLFAAQSCGLRVPEDLSLMTFHETANYFNDICITTMQIPERRMGQAAVEKLLQLLHSPTPLPPQALHCEMLPGTSTAPPP
jgi:LacI family transcriptional regulator